MPKHWIITWLLSLFAATPVYAQSNWPQLRGPHGSGVVEGEKLPESWSTTKNVVWKIEVPGRGWSSPIVWDDRIFVTSAVEEGPASAPQEEPSPGNDREKPPLAVHRRMVYCIDWHTGNVLWERLAHRGVPPIRHHRNNSYATETPVTDGQRVYACFGNLGLFCYGVDGEQLWRRQWGCFPTAYDWGPGASPVLHQDRLYVVNDNEQQSFLVALDTKSGEDVWRVERDEKSNWATPFVWQNEQRTEIVTSGRSKVRSYDLEGRLLWQMGGMASIVIPTPVAGHGLLYLCSASGFEPLRPIFAVRPGASGDITLAGGQGKNAWIAWSRELASPYVASPIVYGDHLYVLRRESFIDCYDARTGETLYERQRIGSGEAGFGPSPWAYAGKVFCLKEDGETFVLPAGPQFKLLGKNHLDEQCLATPAIAGGSLIIRTRSKLYRIAE